MNAPPSGRERLLTLSPPGWAKAGSILACLRACINELPACKDLIKRFRGDAQGLLACQEIVKTQGLCHDTLAQCQPLIAEMPSAQVRQEFAAYLAYQFATAGTLGLDQVGLPISPMRSNRSSEWPNVMAWARPRMRLASPFACRPCVGHRREEAEQVLRIRVARQHEITGQLTSLTKQRQWGSGARARTSKVWARVKAHLMWNSYRVPKTGQIMAQSSIYQ